MTSDPAITITHNGRTKTFPVKVDEKDRAWIPGTEIMEFFGIAQTEANQAELMEALRVALEKIGNKLPVVQVFHEPK